MSGDRATAGDDSQPDLGNEIVGREQELERIAGFVAAHPDGPAALVIEGEPGIGKTTLWRHAVSVLETSGCRILRTTPAAAERLLPLSALTDLLAPAYHLVRTDLHAPQRKAVDVALALAQAPDPNTHDERLLRAATLGCLRALARLGPVGLAIDDTQWVDPDSAAALSYALRRLESERVVCLLSLRSESESALDLEQLGDLPVVRTYVGPLSLGATQRLLLNDLGVTYSRRVIRRLVETSGGNPFFALELARGLERAGQVSPGEPPALSHTLEALIGARLGSVSRPARRLLGLLSLLPAATLQLLDALGALDALDEAVAAGIVEVDGPTVRFTHPLLAAGAYGRLGPEERRSGHAALASALGDPVERAWHLAHGTLAASREAAEELAGAASIAVSRGLPAVAAELSEEAARLTPDSDPQASRDVLLLAARFHASSGSHGRARELLDQVIPNLSRGDARADALRLRGKVTDGVAQQRDLLRQALEETDDPTITSEVNALLVRNYLYAGDLPNALGAALLADEQAARTGDVRRVAAATTTRGLMEIWGTGAPDPHVFERARRMAEGKEPHPTDTYSNPLTLLGARALYRYEAEEARHWYTLAASEAELAGDVDSQETFLWGLAQLEVRAGRFAAAAEYVDRLRESGETYDRRSLSLRWIEGVLATYEGRERDAREALEDTIEQAEAGENWFFVVYGRGALGFLELSVGDAPAAVDALDPVLSMPFVLEGDPGQTGILPVAAEALIMSGVLERAAALITCLEERGGELAHPWCLAVALRCRGLLLGEQRAFDQSFEAFRDALVLHEGIPAPFERARTILALGSTQRRARKRREARETLEAAVAAFEELGTPLWVGRARSEVARVGGRAPAPGDLTPNEHRIAELVSEGKTNKEVAAALFVTDRTVESALTQIYRKLDVRSRTELASKLARRA